MNRQMSRGCTPQYAGSRGGTALLASPYFNVRFVLIASVERQNPRRSLISGEVITQAEDLFVAFKCYKKLMANLIQSEIRRMMASGA